MARGVGVSSGKIGIKTGVGKTYGGLVGSSVACAGGAAEILITLGLRIAASNRNAPARMARRVFIGNPL